MKSDDVQRKLWTAFPQCKHLQVESIWVKRDAMYAVMRNGLGEEAAFEVNALQRVRSVPLAECHRLWCISYDEPLHVFDARGALYKTMQRAIDQLMGPNCLVLMREDHYAEVTLADGSVVSIIRRPVL